ncbi:MAG: alpha/beta fold hydrolase [Verrucomicrobiales bacterium]
MNTLLTKVLILSGAIGSVHAEVTPAGDTFETEVKASEEPLIAHSEYTLWIPRDTPSIRSILAINMRGAGKHLFEQDQAWRALAQRTQSAMLYCQFEAHGVRNNGYGGSMLKACDQFAAELNRPELKHAPFVLWGHSMGGRVAQDFARFKPSRVIAIHIGLRANPSDPEFMREEAEAVKIPALYLMGGEDRKPKDIRQHFHDARKAKSPRAWIWLPGQSHWPKGMGFKTNETTPEAWRAWVGNEVVIPWTETIVRLRLPKSKIAAQGAPELREIDLQAGWLGDVETGAIARYHEFGGSKSTASWFPSEEVARAWVQFSFPERTRSR